MLSKLLLNLLNWTWSYIFISNIMGNKTNIPLWNNLKKSKYDELYNLITLSDSSELDNQLNHLNDDSRRVCNLRNESGATFLMIAVLLGSIDIVNVLLKYGADTNKKDKKGKVYEASNRPYNNFLRIYDFLCLGRTALFYLVLSTSSSAIKIEIARILINNNSRINEEDNMKITCLHDAVKMNDTGSLKTLNIDIFASLQ